MITPEEVEHIGWLARIKLSGEEKSRYAEQLNDILDYFGKIDEVKTDVEPTYHVLELHNVFREDVTSDSLEQVETLANAPKEKDGYFKAPRIAGP
ncbi:MAG: Asp-tRNA(Asn)/Glu-tRNA(Gln) amidotransferase subunit GatC [Euryarchaeota archaeon]|nr:Asp-tRNA(Asn)/Glu-tRNA(Gln) amidotransferase subunit GatC [Euryarchaeota archaeon]